VKTDTVSASRLKEHMRLNIRTGAAHLLRPRVTGAVLPCYVDGSRMASVG